MKTNIILTMRKEPQTVIPAIEAIKHTPGPWVSHNDNNSEYMDIDSKSGKRISSVLIISDEDLQEDEANAKLIAAAPELLSAIQNLLSSYQADFEITCSKLNETEAVKIARAAIKKATE